MPESQIVNIATQIAKETTAGTVVPANKKLAGLSIGLFTNNPEFQTVRSQGYKYPNIVNLNREWSSSSVSGSGANFDDILYVLAGVLGNPTSTLVLGAQQHVFAPSSTAVDTVPTFTVEQSNGVLSQRIAGVYFNSAELTFSRVDGVSISGGDLMGLAIVDAITMTATPTEIAPFPILGGMVDIYMDATFGALGTTKVLRCLSAVWGIGDRQNTVWPLNSALPSYAAMYENIPSATLTLTLANDATARSLFATYRGAGTKFIRLKATGPTIGTNTALLQIDSAVKINDAFSVGDADGLATMDVPFQIVHDSAWGKAVAAQVVNNLTAL